MKVSSPALSPLPVTLDLDALQKAALVAPRRGPYSTSKADFGTFAGSTVGVLDMTGETLLREDGYEGFVDSHMLDYFALVDPDTVLVLVALARIAQQKMLEADQIRFDIPLLAPE